LDIVDPALGDSQRELEFHASLSKIPSTGSYYLWAGFSPTIIPAVAATQKELWSFVMVDGNHDGEAPTLDARVVSEYCENDAMVVFHDLTSPDVAKGLQTMKDLGWRIQIFNTMQIVGVAYRGNVKLVNHISDPNIDELSFPPSK
jgi:hypothetical protein